MATSRYLDPELSTLLDSLRSRVRRYVVWDSVLAILAVVLIGFWIGLLLDYLPVLLGGTEMPRLARMMLLGLVSVAVVVIAITMLIGRLSRPLPDDSLALLVERQHPQLGGRLVTAVQLNEPGRSGDSHSPALLRQVHSQAAAAVDEVDPNRIFRWEPLWRKGTVVVPLLLAAVVFALLSPQSFARAASRLSLLSDEPWPRRADLEMVGVEMPLVTASDDQTLPSELVEFGEDKRARLARGSSGTLRIRARADGAEVPQLCTVYYETDSGTRGQSNMRRVGRVVDGWQSFILEGQPLASLSDSVTLDIRGLDDRLDDYRIEAVSPPAIASLAVAASYPDYLQIAETNQADLETDYLAGLRLPEGSDVTLTAVSSVPLGDVDVLLQRDNGEQSDVAVQFSDDRTRARMLLKDFSSATTVSMVPRDTTGISAQAPYRYYLGVILDEPPSLEVKLPGVGSAVTPIARIPVEVSASDDYGVDELIVSVNYSGDSDDDASDPSDDGSSDEDDANGTEELDGAGDETNQTETTQSPRSASVEPPLSRDGNAKAVLDLRELTTEEALPELIAGNSLQIIGEVTDRYDLGSPHRTRSEVFQLQVVTADQLLSLLERRELALRARLEQTIDETRNLRDTLDMLRRQGFESAASETSGTDESPSVEEASGELPSGQDSAAENSGDEANDVSSDALREVQIRRLRVQQSGLQANKTSEELSGIAASLDDILREMINNRVDSVDRRERLGTAVRDPLKQIVAEPLQRLRNQITQIEQSIEDAEQAQQQTAAAVATAEQVLLQLNAVLEKMLDLESYNEILDMVRQLIDDQENLLEETKQERKRRVLDLFN